MTDYLLTALIPMAFFVVFYGSKEAENQNGFMSREYTTIMKAVCCIIVILVHIPAAYTNRLQDAMGSFAYVCVTLFFLMSAYGMSLSKERRRNYMQHFWRNRLAALLIPQLLINICSTIWVYINTQKEYASLFHINNYVVVLLGYCFWFWLVYQGRRWYGHRIANTLLVGGVIISSLGSYFFMEKDANYWCYERWGLVWGVFALLVLTRDKEACMSFKEPHPAFRGFESCAWCSLSIFQNCILLGRISAESGTGSGTYHATFHSFIETYIR